MSRTTDTVQLARKMFPGSPASLDALCKKFKIDCSNRKLHGALLDSQLLAEVYQELMGGRQGGLTLEVAQTPVHRVGASLKKIRTPRVFSPSAEELSEHSAFVNRLKNALWNRS